MSIWRVLRGNTCIQAIPVKKANGELVEDLADAEEIIFLVKSSLKDNAEHMIMKSKGISGGGGIEIDNPKLGYLLITLLPSDTNITPAKLYMGLQIRWSEDRQYEVLLKVGNDFTNQFEIVRDIVVET